MPLHSRSYASEAQYGCYDGDYKKYNLSSVT